jgi:hypothetical protein
LRALARGARSIAVEYAGDPAPHRRYRVEK